MEALVYIILLVSTLGIFFSLSFFENHLKFQLKKWNDFSLFPLK